MRKSLTFLLLLACAQASHAVLVDGYCYLEGETNHSGTKVKFIGFIENPDSTYTESSGYFSIDIEDDVYDVEYSHAGFDTVMIEWHWFVSDETLPPMDLWLYGLPISGTLSGALGPGIYQVVDTIYVDSGDSLRLLPGTTFRFGGPYPFYIYGILLAGGTGNDSVVFTTHILVNPDGWRSLRFSGTGSSGSGLAYCRIEKGNVNDDTPNGYGGGVYCSCSSPTFTNCTINANSADYGGGVCCSYSSAIFTNCTVSGNSAYDGGGVSCRHSSPIFANCTMDGNSATGSGGGLNCGDSSSVILTNCIFSGNAASSNGGGVYCNNNSSLAFSNCTIMGNTGSGVFCDSSSCGFENCTIDSNRVRFSGGGVYLRAASLSRFANCTVSDNWANEGGGIFCDLSSPTIENCTISGNSASGPGGGGIACYNNSSPTLTNCILTGNVSMTNGCGGGVDCENNSSATFVNCSIDSNWAYWYGGGVYCDGSSLPSFANCTVRDNIAGEIGGGVNCYYASFANCTISGNEAEYGGGVFCGGYPSTFIDCIITNNSARYNGGGVYSDRDSSIFTNCTFTANSAGDNGGGVWCDGSSPTFTNCILSHDSASNDGGGVYCSYSSPTFSNCTFNSNSANRGGGAYCYYCWMPRFKNCILWGNTPEQIVESSSYLSVTYSDVQGGWSGIGNRDADPLFVSGYYLSQIAAGQVAQSPCVDAGNPSSPMILGTTRTDGAQDAGVVDMGYHYQTASPAEPPISLTPTTDVLHPNWPNPFNSSTMIRYDLAQAGKVSLTIFNLLGQEVARLANGPQLAGTYTVSWNAGNFPSGVYLCRMETSGFLQTRKLVLVK
jgi:parallel beta-helix repeat protein